MSIIIFIYTEIGDGAMDNGRLERVAHLCIAVVTALLALWLFIKYILASAIPVIIAVLISSALRPAAHRLAKGSGRPEKVYGVILSFVVFFAVFYGLFCLGGKLIREMSEFLSSSLESLESEDNILKQTLDFFEGLKSRFPAVERLVTGESSALPGEVYETVKGTLVDLVTAAGKRITAFVTGFIAALPGVVFSCAVSIISVFYLTVDYAGVKKGIRRIMPRGAYEKLSRAVSGGGAALSGCLKAYLVLMLLTFAELFFGFIVLRVKYAFFLAAVTAIVDFLPVLGVGTVLIPWSALLFIRGETGRAVGFLVLFGVMYVVRQFAEPRLVGKFTGIHPMITLVSAYLGFTFFGVVGMLASPIVLYGLKSFFSVERERKDRPKGQ